MFHWEPAYTTLLIIAVMVVLLFYRKIPSYIVALLVMGALIVTGVVPADEMFAGFSDTTTLIILFMGPVGEALIRTGAGTALGNGIISFAKGSERRVLLLVIFAGTLLSAATPHTGAFLALMPITVTVAEMSGIPVKNLMLPLAISTAFGGKLTLVGSTPNIMTNKFCAEAGIREFGFFEFGHVGIVIAVLGTILLVALYGRKRKDTAAGTSVERQEQKIELRTYPVPQTKKGKFHMWCSVAIMILAALLMVFIEPLEEATGINIAAVALIMAVLTVLTGCLKPAEFLQSVPWDAVLLFASLIGVGVAMEQSGAAQLIASGILGLFPNASPMALLAIMFLTSGIIAQFMSQTAALGIMAPIFLLVGQEAGMNPQIVLMAVCTAVGLAVATPIGTPPNVVAAARCGYTFGDFMKVGIPVMLIAFVVSMVMLPMIYPLMA